MCHQATAAAADAAARRHEASVYLAKGVLDLRSNAVTCVMLLDDWRWLGVARQLAS